MTEEGKRKRIVRRTLLHKMKVRGKAKKTNGGKPEGEKKNEIKEDTK